VTLSVGEGVGG